MSGNTKFGIKVGPECAYKMRMKFVCKSGNTKYIEGVKV